MRKHLLWSLTAAQLHFASVGNWGSGNAQQAAVARAMKAAAVSPPLSFVVSPGSNFMEGVSDLDDERWVTQFRDVYAGPELNCPWFVALGARDWDGNVTAMVQRTNTTYGQYKNLKELEQTSRELFSAKHLLTTTEDRGPRWTLPNFYYHYVQTFTDSSSATTFMAAPEVSVFFTFLDTKILQQGFLVPEVTEKHWEDLETSLTAASKIYDWIIVVGDEAIYSSGTSGGSKYLRMHLRDLLRKNLVDAYISGKDRVMELIEDGALAHINCGTGSGGRHGKFLSHDSSQFFSKRPGFCYHTLTKNTFNTQFIDGITGKTLYATVKKRNIKNDLKTDKLKWLTTMPHVKYTPLPAGIGGAPGGENYRVPNNIFVIICGTIGLLLASLIATAGALTTNVRISRWTGQPHHPYVPTTTKAYETTLTVFLVLDKQQVQLKYESGADRRTRL